MGYALQPVLTILMLLAAAELNTLKEMLCHISEIVFEAWSLRPPFLVFLFLFIQRDMERFFLYINFSWFDSTWLFETEASN